MFSRVPSERHLLEDGLTHLLSFLIVMRFQGNPSHLLPSPKCRQAHLAGNSKIHEHPRSQEKEASAPIISRRPMKLKKQEASKITT